MPRRWLLKSFLNWLHQNDFSQWHPSCWIFQDSEHQLWFTLIRAFLASHCRHSLVTWFFIYGILFSVIFTTNHTCLHLHSCVKSSTFSLLHCFTTLSPPFVSLCSYHNVTSFYMVYIWNYAQAYHSRSDSFSVWVKLNSDEVGPLEVYAGALHLSPQCWSNTAPRPAFHVHADGLALHFSFAVSGLKRFTTRLLRYSNSFW